jgi:hypothetical protein
VLIVTATISKQVVLQALPDDQNAAAVRWNSGTIRISASGADVFIPRDDWGELQPMEPAIGAVSLADGVTVFKLGTDLVTAFRRELPGLLNPVSTTTDFRSQRLASFGKEVAARLAHAGIETLEFRVCNVAVNKPGVKSTGQDFATNAKVGLHIDNHDRLPLSQRQTAVQLLALNCGSSPRYFNFIDLPVEELARRTDTPLDDPSEDLSRASQQLKDQFLSKNPDYSITGVCLPPGYAYIATPQNIIHDGAASSGAVADVAFLMLGRFRFAGDRR